MTEKKIVKKLCVVYLLTTLVFGAFSAGVTVTKGTGKFYEPNANKFENTVVTPHIPWAKPYARGKIRALIIGARRETIELAQRMDLDYTVFVTPRPRELGNDRSRFLGSMIAHGFTRKEKEKELSKKLDGDYDVIILRNNWDSLSKELKLKLLWKIRNGTGFLGAKDKLKRNGYLWEAFKRHPVKFPDMIFSGVPIKAMPKLFLSWQTVKLDKGLIRTARLGKGRMLWFNLSTLGGKMHGLVPRCEKPESYLDNEYFNSMIIKSLQWVSKKEPKIEFKKMSINAKNTDAGILLLTLKNTSGKNEKTTLEIIDRMNFDITSHRALSTRKEKLNIPPGITKKQFVLKNMAGGRHFIDLIIRNKRGQVINWGTVFFDLPIAYGLHVNAPKKGKYGKSIRGELRFSSPPANGVKAKLQLVDNYGRELQQVLLTKIAGKTSVSFELEAKQPLTQLLSLRVKLEKGERLLQEKWQPYIVTEFNRRFDNNDFHMVMFSGHFMLTEYDYAFSQHLREFSKLGVDTHLVLQSLPGTPCSQKKLDRILRNHDYKAMTYARQNIWMIPYFNRYNFDIWYSKTTKIDSKVRTPCLTDPKYLANLNKYLLGGAEVWGKYSPVAYSLGDESNLAGFHTDICHSPTCLIYFRKWLKGYYASLNDLNKQWGVNYKSWNQVVPMTFKEAKSSGNPSSWVDHWRCMESNWVDFLKHNRKVISSVDPNCRIGLEGDMHSRNYYTGYDWWKLSQVLEFMGPYKIMPELDSFAKKGSLIGSIYGGYSGASEGMMKTEPWNALFNGGNSMLYWSGKYTFKGDLIPTRNVTWAAEGIRNIKQGAAKALLTAKSENDGIVILYSRPSMIAEIFLAKVSKAVNSMKGIEEWLRDIQLSFKYISHEQLEEGILNNKKFKMLVMPFTQALSLRGGLAIKKFVSEGGVVLADMRPAIVDDHGRSYKKGLLDEVFGIKRNANGKISKAAPVTITDKGLMPGFSGNLLFKHVDSQVRCAGGRAIGRAKKVPAVIINSYKKGKGILLNFPFASFTKQFVAYTQYSSNQLLKGVLAKVGINAKVAITGRNGKDIVGTNSFFFKRGKVRYLGCIPYMEKLQKFATVKPEPATIKLDKKAHIYDTRTGKYLGYGNKIKTDFVWTKVKLYALLPYRPEAPVVNINSAIIPLGKEVKVKIQIKGNEKIGDHTVRLKVFYPDGKLYSPYCRNLLACGGQAEFMLYTALNDPKGKYRVVVTDVTTGQIGKTTFLVK